MRSFDVKALNRKPTQLWTAMKASGYSVHAQVADPEYSNIVFTTDHVSDNRPITSDSVSSIRLTSSPGIVQTAPLIDFEMSMVVYPRQADIWIVKLTAGTDGVGVKISPNWTMSLVWLVEGELIEEQIIFTKQVSYLALSVNGGVASLQLNDKQALIEGDELEFETIEFGGGADGEVLVDKIVLSDKADLPTISDYFTAFRSQRLDTVARPFGAAAFAYINDVSTPSTKTLRKDDFKHIDGMAYAAINNGMSLTVSIDNKTGFYIEYSVNNGLAWFELPAELTLEPSNELIILRHNMITDLVYRVDIRFSDEPVIVLPYADAVIDGYAALEEYVGIGYYDASVNELSNASLTLTSDTGIKTLEMLVEYDVDWFNEVTNVEMIYVNGKPGGLKKSQLYHMVIIYTEPQTSITLNPRKAGSFKLAGIGVSDIAYSESDAYYIFNTFAGNVYTSAIQTIGGLVDGLSPNSLDGHAASAIQVEWNS